MVCEGGYLKCLSSWPEGEESAEGVGRSRDVLQASKLPREMGTVKKLLGLWQIVIRFQNLLRGS